MDKDERFDHIVGLIYDTAPTSQGPDTIIDAISCEFDTLAGSQSPRHATRDLVRHFVSRVVLPGRKPGAAGSDPSPGSPEGLSGLAPSESGHADAHTLLRRLAPHMERSTGLRHRMQHLEEQYAIREMELAHLPVGLVWVGQDLRVIAGNLRGDAILMSADGLGLRDGRLFTWLAADLERLEAALRAAMRPVERKSRLLAIRRRTQPLPLLVTVIPVLIPPNAREMPTGLLALLVLQNPNQANFSLEHLQLLYGFTDAERTLAEALLRNETVESFADLAGVSRNTVRTHLARLFAKTGTARQAELVRLLMLARPAI